MKNGYNVRFYKPEDFEAVIRLLAETDMNTSFDPYSFGSKSLVIENKDGVIGFIWVIAGDSKIVYIGDFVIAKKYWYRKNHPGVVLGKALFGLLGKMGYEGYLANVNPNQKKMYKMLTQKLKGSDRKEHFLIRGTIKEFNESLLSF